ncbi:BspA family leucine-rich repeat surface protein [Candidatus Enterenecus avicola]
MKKQKSIVLVVLFLILFPFLDMVLVFAETSLYEQHLESEAMIENKEELEDEFAIDYETNEKEELPENTQFEPNDISEDGEKEATIEDSPHSSDSSDTSITDQIHITGTENQLDDSITVLSGVWGDVSWNYDSETYTCYLSGGNAGLSEDAPWRKYNTTLWIESIVVEEIVLLPEDTEELFASIPLVNIENISYFDVSKVTNMSRMFSESVIPSLDLNNWDTSNVVDMTGMFSNSQIEELKISNFNTSNVGTMAGMFMESQVKELDLSSWDTSRLNNATSMFQNSQVESLNLSAWNTSNLQHMQAMFMNTIAEELNLSNWNISGAETTAIMFFNSQVKELDLSNWDTSTISNMQGMFGLCSNLRRLRLGSRSRFSSTTQLPNITASNDYTGRWILEENPEIVFLDSFTFMTEYDGSFPGTYIWETVPLIGSLDPVSDQSTEISGFMSEKTDILRITYQNTSDETIVIENNSLRIEWGNYKDTEASVRAFTVKLEANERLATNTIVSLFISKTTGIATEEVSYNQQVMKGIEYSAYNITLDRFKINELANEAALHTLILEESRAHAKNVLTHADMTTDFRVIDTDVTLDVDEDGSYYAVLEVGNKPYQQVIGIDVTSNLDHLRVTIPIKMVFESLYNEKESNRNFESQAYEIRNQSPLAVDTYINQMVIDDSAGMVLLRAGEDPLDYAENDEEDSNLTYQNISTPLLRLNLKTEETEIQLYEEMEERHLVRLEERSRIPISLTGDFYGDYPRWVVDAEEDQGGYYEDSLVPNYRIILRFVPRD